MKRALTRAVHGLSLAKDAQARPLLPAFHEEFGRDRLPWLDELAPTSLFWDEARLKLTYTGAQPVEAAEAEETERDDDDSAPAGPEVQIKLGECFPHKTHPRIAEGKIPVRLWLQLPDGKRLEATDNWPVWREQKYPKHRAVVRAKYPGFLWP